MNCRVSDRLRMNILLEDISEAEFNFLLPRLRENHYIAGEVILEDESEGSELHLILEGRVKITRQTRFGDQYRIALLHPGDFFGEVSLIDGRPRIGRVTAVDDCTTFILGKSDFDRLLEESHPFALRLLLVVSIRHRSQNNHFIHELQIVTRRLLTEVRRLDKIIEASKMINSALDLDRLLKAILETALKISDAERGTVYLIDGKKKELWSRTLEAAKPLTIHLPIGKGIAGYVAATGDTLNIPDAYLDARFNPEVDKQTGLRTRTILCMPMRNKDGRIVGVLQLLNKRDGIFTSEDENAIGALSVHAALAVEKERLYQQEREKLVLEKDLSAAHTVQVQLLPKQLPVVEDYEFAAKSLPAKSVAGDLYDFMPLEGGYLGFSLGDVSGKGMPAALLMANVQATVRVYARPAPHSGECLAQANSLLFRSTSPEKFVTLFYGILDTNNHRLVYTNAGHENPLFIHGNELLKLTAGGPPLAVLDNINYGEDSIEFLAGDVLIVYSDGILDAVNSAGERFGLEKLEETVRGSASLSAEEMSARLLSSVTQHMGDASQFDDITLLIVKRVK